MKIATEKSQYLREPTIRYNHYDKYSRRVLHIIPPGCWLPRDNDKYGRAKSPASLINTTYCSPYIPYIYTRLLVSSGFGKPKHAFTATIYTSYLHSPKLHTCLMPMIYFMNQIYAPNKANNQTH